MNRMQIRRRQQISLVDRSVTVCLHAPGVVSIVAEVDPFEVLKVRRVSELCLKAEVTLKVYFKKTVAMQ